MKEIRCDQLALLLLIYPEKEAVQLLFKTLDGEVILMRQQGIETDFIETIIFEDKEYHRKDYAVD